MTKKKPTRYKQDGPRTQAVRYNIDPSGYCRWTGSVKYDGFTVTYVHQLIAIADGGDPHKVYSRGKHQCHHKNGIPWDNRPDNIEVLSSKKHTAKHIEDMRKAGENRIYTDEDLLSWISAFVEEFGIVPTISDVKEWPGPSDRTYRNRFGTFANAVKKAGYTPRSER